MKFALSTVLLFILAMQSGSPFPDELTDNSLKIERSFTDSNAYYYSMVGILAGGVIAICSSPALRDEFMSMEDRLLWILLVSISAGAMGYIIGGKLDDEP